MSEMIAPDKAIVPAPDPGTGAGVAHLRRQSSRDIGRQRQLAVVAGLAIAAFLLLVYFPSTAALQSLRERIRSGLAQLEVDQERSRSLPQLRATSEQLERQLSAFKPIGTEAAVGEFIGRAAEMSTQLRLRDLSCQPANSTVSGSLVATPVLLTASGDFANVYAFLRQCEQMPQWTRVQKLRIRQQPKQGDRPLLPGEVHAELVVVIFHHEASRPGAANG